MDAPPTASSPIALQSDQLGANLPPVAEHHQFSLWHYLKEAFRIIVWNEDAVQRTKDDPMAIVFGVCFWAFTNTFILAASFSIFRGRFILPSALYFTTVLPIQFVTVSAVSIARLWIVHFVATTFCGGDGRFIQILRPLSLASLIQLPIAVIPLILAVSGFGDAALVILGLSAILIGLANAAVTVFVFDAVDQMPQLTAFITSVVAGIFLNYALHFIMEALKH
jgi:hypothetical protein